MRSMRVIQGTLLFVLAAAWLPSQADIQAMQLAGGGFVMADIPCKAAVMRASSATDSAVGKTCTFETDGVACAFLIADAHLDQTEFRRRGMAFIENIHTEYAKSLDKAYVSVRQATREWGGIGPAVEYEFLRNGGALRVTGLWLPYQGRLLRATATCQTPLPPSMASVRSRFLASFSVVR